MNQTVYAPGARVVIRDAEWIVRRADRTSTGGQALSVVGISEIVKDREAIFLTEIDSDIRVVDPAKTKFILDRSPSYRDTLLYIESLLRQTPPTDDKLYIGYKGAVDAVPYQLDPAIQALAQPRQRILLADAVGLGKTIECGILLSELIRRGKGKRILVCAIKSMLTQFQKELWARFTIPLVRLDSVGIQRIRGKIPTNHNPFSYYDHSIISIDTLKPDRQYRRYLENSWWDIIVIDEAQNVADRGGNTLRARLAKLLSSRSDTLIMLSATPHDGKARSFASLMNMLNPTAIANPDDYGPKDIKGLYIRRFKKDIKQQVASAFQERVIQTARPQASELEEKAFKVFSNITFTRLDRKKTAGELFKTTLEKALFSSPAACLQTTHNRINKLRKEDSPEYAQDIEQLEELAAALKEIFRDHFSKYQALLDLLQDKRKGFAPDKNDPSSRVVIFTERIETMKFLHESLKLDLKLRPEEIETLSGLMDDVEQQAIVEDFGKDTAPVHILIASDVASEGINLHYLCHRMIHFDIPWSLMVFQQRNGRIDRYGQEKQPRILYLVTQSLNPKIKGDTRILELLAEKDEQATKNVGDASAFMGVYDIEEEEKITGAAFEESLSVEDFEKRLQQNPIDPLAILMGGDSTPIGESADLYRRTLPSMFSGDFEYFKEGIEFLRRSAEIQAEFDVANRFVNLTATKDLEYRLRLLPNEIHPTDGQIILTADRQKIQREISRCRKEEIAWPAMSLLWEMHPVVAWLNDKMLSVFGRHEAPVISLPGALDKNQRAFVLSGLIPNRKAHPLIHRWFVLLYKNDRFEEVIEFSELLVRTALDRKRFPNVLKNPDLDELSSLLPDVVGRATKQMSVYFSEYSSSMGPKLKDQLETLKELRKKRYEQLELRFPEMGPRPTVTMTRKEREQREIDRIFEHYASWIEDSMKTEDHPFIRIVAVLVGES